MAEAEQTILNTEVEFVYYKINTFTERHVYKELIPEVNRKLDDIKKMLDVLVMKWLTHKVKYKESSGLEALEKKITELTELVDNNEMKVRLKVASLEVSNNSRGSTSLFEDKINQEPSQKSGMKSRRSSSNVKKNEFSDQVDLLSISCGMDLGNPETEIESDSLKDIFKQKDDGEISRLMRESKSWPQCLVSLSKVFREYEELAKGVG